MELKQKTKSESKKQKKRNKRKKKESKKEKLRKEEEEIHPDSEITNDLNTDNVVEEMDKTENTIDDEDNNETSTEEQGQVELEDDDQSKLQSNTQQHSVSIKTPQTDQEALEQIMSLLQNPEDILLPPVSNPPLKQHTNSNKNNELSKQGKLDTKTSTSTEHPTKENGTVGVETKLIQLTQYLFTRMEQLAFQHDSYQRKKELASSSNDNDDIDTKEEDEEKKEEEEKMKVEEELDTCPLSGINELYIPEQIIPSSISSSSSSSTSCLDMETIWSQVEIQNQAFMEKIHSSIKQTKKRLKKNQTKNADLEVPCLLDMNQEYSDDEEDEGDEDDEIDDVSEEGERGSGDVNEEKEESEEDEEDDETKRMRQRMERAMADMEEDDDDAFEEDKTTKKEEEDEEELEDPAADELNDGFFDIHDMEEFADEEEDIHAFTNEDENDDENRDGDKNDDDDEEDDEYKNEEDDMGKTRKKYRDDEVIDALHTLYEDTNDNNDDSEEEDEDDVINMTAADYFGKPKGRFFKNWRGHQSNESNKLQKEKKNVHWNIPDAEDVNDDDSWNDYNFDKSKNDDDEDGEKNADWPIGDGKIDEENDNIENDKDNENDPMNETSTTTVFSKQQQKLEKQTKLLEDEMLAEKPWQMKGETKSSSRPINSLLESTPEFTMASKIAPTITVEHTTNLEDIIKARILAEDWDDVIPRELPDIFKNKRGSSDIEDVSQEKSKLSLGELYEREYLKKAVGYDVDKVEKETAEDKAKNEMKQLFANLCSKLDAMSNYHFAPRPVMEEADVREVTTPAIAMEEVIPMHVSDQRGVAPEEIYDGGRRRGKSSVLKGESEMDQNDRKRLRNTKKAARRKARREKLADEKLVSRLQPAQNGLNNPYEKRKLREELSMARSRGKIITGEIDENKDFTTSTKFFKRMQEDTKMEIHGTGEGAKKRKLYETGQTQGNSSAYKL